MSFDDEHGNYHDFSSCSLNPFRAGRCLSTEGALPEKVVAARLNPFRAGRCLSTKKRLTN